MKLTLEVIEKNKVKIDWSLLYVALYYNYIETIEIIKYVEQLISYDEFLDNEFIISLLWGNISDKDDILYGIKSNFVNNLVENDDEWMIEKRKLRYVILKNIIYENKNKNEKILKLVAEVYADFDYPIEMQKFVYYIPNENNNENNKSIDENRRQLISFLLEFLKNEELYIF